MFGLQMLHGFTSLKAIKIPCGMRLSEWGFRKGGRRIGPNRAMKLWRYAPQCAFVANELH